MKPVVFDKTASQNLKNGFESPLSRLPLLNSQIEAKTPDLFEAECDTSKTPAIRRSLGVQPDLDVSWCSDMATPQNPHRFPCPMPPNVTPDIGIQKISEQSLIRSDHSNQNRQQESRVISDNQVESPLLIDDVPIRDKQPENNTECKSTVNIGSLLRKRNSAFVYPEPVKIQVTPQRPKALGAVKKTDMQNNQIVESHQDSPVMPSQRRRKPPKEIRKSLKFTAESFESSFESSSATDILHTLEYEEDRVVENSTPSFESKPHTDAEVVTKPPHQEPSTVFDFANNHKIGRNETLNPGHPLAGFATANGKNVAVSNESLARARAMFEEEDDSEPSHSVKMQNTTERFRGNQKPITGETLDSKERKQIQDSSSTIEFSTANGKNMTVSEKALTQAKILFEKLEKDKEFETEQTDPAIKLTSKGKQLLPHPHSEKNEKEASFAQNSDSKFLGFNTAAGRKLTMSKEAIQRAQKLFASIDDEENISLAKSEVTSSKEIPPQTEISRRSLNVSNEAYLQRAKKEFEEIEQSKASLPTNKMYSGNQPSMGFQSAGGKCLTVSEAAMKKARALFDNLEPESPDISSKPAVGFSTASGRNVSVSKEALERARSLFDEASTEMNPQEGYISNSGKSHGKITPIAPGFSTAGGRSLVISEKALAQAKKLFEETEDELLVKKTEDDHQTMKDQNPRKAIAGLNAQSRNTASASGFSTAGGKNVVISDKALARARQLFSDTDEDAALIASIEDASGSEQAKSQSSDVSKSSSSRKRKVDEDEATEEEEAWISSPTIGKKRKKNRSPPLPSTPMLGTPLSAFDNAPTCVSRKALVLRRRAREQQASLIQLKVDKKVKVVPKPGRKLENKHLSRSTIKELIGQSNLPKPYKPYELLNSFEILPSVCLVSAANAHTFNFFAWEHFSVEECRNNANGFQLGDFNVILSDDNIIGCDEISSSFLASQHVDPNLINMEWILNHYRWIVWKLASMELKIPQLFARNTLTPLNVLEQLKYRYDAEVDSCKRSALKRIIEQDDTAAKTIVLCVAQIRSNKVLELTDGWYSIDAHCDPALSQLIENGKVFVGLKLIISGAELVAPGPSSPLEKGSDTYLKISANSTRRAKWDLKLGYFSNPHPFSVTLKSVLPEGGLVSHTEVTIVRAYPVVYMEKTADGKTLFHSERHYRRLSEGLSSKYERMMEKVVETIEREEEQDRKRSRSDASRYQNLTDEEKRNRIHAEARKRIEKSMQSMKTMDAIPLLKLRVIDTTSTDCNSAIVSVWRPTEELQSHLKEGRCYHLYNVNAAGLRFGELQLNSLKHTMWKEFKSRESAMPQNLTRVATSFETACQPSFKPVFNELDLVGLVVHVGEQQAKSPFQTIILSDGSNYFGIKCWSSLEEYSLAETVKTGTFLAFVNLQWRTTASRTTSKMPFAFIYEGTIVSSRPALKHVASALEEVKKNVTDVAACISDAEEQIPQLVGNTTPHSATPKFGTDLRRSMFTPSGTCTVDGRKETPTTTNPTVSRARLLEKYGNPPALSALNNIASPHVRQKFKPPARKSLA